MSVDFIKYLGYPMKQGYPHYALYQPTLGCFLLIADNKDHLIKIKNLTTSRYNLTICQIDCATNYEFNLIDNNCCENWMPSFVGSGPDFTDIGTVTEFPVHKLVQSEINNSIVVDIEKEKEWLQYLWYWIRFLEKIPDLYVSWYHQKKLMSEIVLHEFRDTYKEMDEADRRIADISRILFFSQDTTDAHAQLMSYIAADCQLNEYFVNWHNQAYSAIQKNVY